MPNDFDDVFKPRKLLTSQRFTLVGIRVRSDSDVVLIGKHAGRGNKAYMNALLKRAKASDAQVGVSLTPDKLDLNDAEFRQMFSRHVLTGWENVNGPDGNPWPFNADRCLAFLNKLAQPDQYPELVVSSGPIDRYFSNGENFRVDDDTRADASALGEG